MMGMTAGRFSLLPTVMIVSALLAASPVLAQNTNTTSQAGKVNINITSQCGDSNDNSTYQDGRVNINRTHQGGCNEKKLKTANSKDKKAKKGGKHKH